MLALYFCLPNLVTNIVDAKLDDGTLYNVHRYFFETHAPKFTEDHLGDPERSMPIKLAGVSGVDFQRFLSIVYPTCVAIPLLTYPAHFQ